MTSRALRWAGAVIATLLSAAPALAQDQSPAIAEGLFQQARELVKQGRYDEACPKLAESQRLDPKLGTLLNLAVCHERQGRTATAWAEYTSAAAIARRDGQREREEFAHKQAAALDKKIARVILQVSAPDAGLTLKLDGQPMSAAVFGVPLPVDPGRHPIVASAPGKAPWSRDLDVPAQPGEILVAVPPLGPAVDHPPAAPPVIATPPPVAAPPPPVAAPPPPSPPPSNTPAVLMGVGFGVGGLGVLVGAIAGGVTISNASSIRAKCMGDACPGQQGSIDSANTLANVSNAFFAIGAVGVAIGITGVVLRPKAPATTAVTLTPVVGAASSGVRIAF